ncbi:ribonucleoside-diphosphate reductase small chain, putative [Medicago truncatula]|uniref:Ribonucleoside-diphosphate reductase small chain, putative n=1 Tax=Medicago truncatula TaxID=3880 RepID=G7KQ12_MEDTR|nr:ribonucleoside-diphosphate reductase small chain, putative [Medicago truncatula]
MDHENPLTPKRNFLSPKSLRVGWDERLLDELGCEKVYNVHNPFDWMDLILLQGKTIFLISALGSIRKLLL